MSATMHHITSHHITWCYHYSSLTENNSDTKQKFTSHNTFTSHSSTAVVQEIIPYGN